MENTMPESLSSMGIIHKDIIAVENPELCNKMQD